MAKSFTIDGEAVVLGPDGLSQFEDLRRREAAHKAILYAFDLIERDGEDLRDLPFLDLEAALARLLRNTEAGRNRCPRGSVSFSAAPASSAATISNMPLKPPRGQSRAALGHEARRSKRRVAVLHGLGRADEVIEMTRPRRSH
jgi:hypothetical protein